MTEPTQPPEDPFVGDAGDTVPLSRREAREAATRAQEPDTAPATETETERIVTAAPTPVTVPTSAAASSPIAAAASASASAPRPTPPAVPATPLDDLFPEARPVRSQKRKRGPGRWIALAIVVVLLGGIAAGGAWVWNTYNDQIRSVFGWQEPKDYQDGIAEGTATVTIRSGDGGQRISQTLADAGVTKTPEAFYDMLVTLDSAPTFYPGVYKLQQKMSAKAALAALENPANKMDYTAQLPEGLTVDQTIERLSEALDIPLADFQAAVARPADYQVAADSLEGWLFPATYTFDPGVTAAQIIQRMVDRTGESLDAANVPLDQRQRVLTIASIIQREARQHDDFYKVSRVIQNRLDDGMMLQMDSTAQYGYGELHDGTVSSSAEALTDDNPWNTYVITGLPKGPISNPGDVAIDAAVNPAPGPWLYFVTVNLDTGETVFNVTVEEHDASVEQWRAWCKANPDSGC